MQSIISETTKLWDSFSFSKYCKIFFRFWKCKKNWENIFRFWDNCIWKCCCNFPLLRREFLLLAANRLTNSPKNFLYHLEGLFQLQLRSPGWTNMVKVMSFGFQKCFVPFTMSLCEVSSETRLFRDLSNLVFRSP